MRARLLIAAFLAAVLASGAAAQETPLQADLRALRARVLSHWVVPSQAQFADIRMTMKIRIGRDRYLASGLQVATPGSGPVFEAVRQSAERAIARSQPFDMLRPEAYDSWKELELVFDTRDSPGSAPAAVAPPPYQPPPYQPPPTAGGAAPPTGAAPMVIPALSGEEDAVMQSWRDSVIRKLHESFQYPASSRQRREEGVVTLVFFVDRSGRLSQQSVAQTSGYPDLDRAAIDMLQRAQPFPPIPMHARDERLSVRVPVMFALSRSGPRTPERAQPAAPAPQPPEAARPARRPPTHY